MQITIGELYEAHAALGQLAAKELPMKSALKVRRLARAVVEHVTDANAERDKLIDKYGQKDEAGRLVHGEGNTIQLAFPAEFQASWNELLSASVEIDDKLRLAESDLGDDGSIAANVLIGLGELLGE